MKRANALVEKKSTSSPRRSTRMRTCIERYVPGLSASRPPKFHIVPRNEWDWLVRKLGCSTRNMLEWSGGTPLPAPPASGGCWLLPCKCVTSVEIAKSQHELAAMGWKLLTCSPSVVARIGQKANLHNYAAGLGLIHHLPKHWGSPETASYPCILKASVGDHGRDVFIVHSPAEAHEKATGGGFGSRWLLQELCAGRIEHATSLLVQRGKILDAICTDYVYDREVYVWPFVEEDEERRRSHSDIPDSHLKAMAAFLTDVHRARAWPSHLRLP